MPNLGWGLKSILKWCMVGFDSKNMHQKTCFKKRLDYMLKSC